MSRVRRSWSFRLTIRSNAAMTRSSSSQWLKYGFVGPTLVFLLAMNIFPLVYTIYLGFTDRELAEEKVAFVGGKNFGNVFGTVDHPERGRELRNPEYARALRTTAIFVFFAVSIELLLGFGLAMLLRDRHPFKGKAVVLMILLVPMMLSPAVMGKFWSYILHGNYGVINQILAGVLGKTSADMPQWWTDTSWQLFTILVIDIWMWTPFMMLISMAGLNAIPNYIYEAAEIDRASTWTVFSRITLPMCAPLLMLAVLLRTTDALKQFDLVMAITGPNNDATQTLSALLYQVMFSEGYLGKGAAYGIVILVVVIAMAVVFTRYLGRIQRQTGGGE